MRLPKKLSSRPSAQSSYDRRAVAVSKTKQKKQALEKKPLISSGKDKNLKR